MELLLSTLEVAESRAWSLCHGGSFVASTDSRSVVCSNAKCGIANVVVVGHDGKLGENACMLKVAVGHVP